MTPKQKYARLQNQIKGHIVEFPYKYLENKDLTLSPGDLEYYVADDTFL